MRLLAFLLILTLVFPASAQTANQLDSNLPTLRTGTRLVVVDVVVTDKSGNAVHGLKASDFKLFENNQSQEFKNFEEHVALTGARASRVAPMPKMPAGVFTNFTPAPTDGPLNILLLDRLNTAVADQMQMQKQIIDFLNVMKPGERLAVFGLTDHLQYLQGFTSDPRILKAVVEGKGKAMASSLLQNPAGSNTRPQTISQQAEDWTGSLLSDVITPDVAQQIQETIALLNQYEQTNTSFQMQIRAKYTLDAMNLLARYLSAFPGRKNLVWFSGSFPVNILPSGKVAQQLATGTGVQDISLSNPFAGVETMEREFRQTSALLSRGQVAVYPVAVKGLGEAAMFAAETTSSGASDLRYSNGQSSLNDFAEENFSNNSTMFMMADDTGGKAMINTNDLAQAMSNALETGANYYTIAYSPTDPRLDGGFRTITVKLRQTEYKLSYRRGYFAEDTERRQPLQDSKAPPTNTMQLALMHGGPNPMQLIFSVKVQPVNDKLEMELAKDNKPGKKAGKAPFRRYQVSYAIDPSELRYAMGVDGLLHDTLEFIVYVYDAQGNLIESVANAAMSNIPPQVYEQLLRVGVPFHQEISVPAKGDYYLRIAVHDVKPDFVGAVEVSVASVGKLPTLEMQAKAEKKAKP